jgi:hypothetical protein
LWHVIASVFTSLQPFIPEVTRGSENDDRSRYGDPKASLESGAVPRIGSASPREAREHSAERHRAPCPETSAVKLRH